MFKSNVVITSMMIIINVYSGVHLEVTTIHKVMITLRWLGCMYMENALGSY